MTRTRALTLAGMTIGGFVVAGAGSSCSKTQTVPATGLEVIVATDGLDAPTDFDDIQLKVSEQVDGGSWVLKWERDYVVPSMEATLPATFGIGAGNSPGEEALVSVTAFKGGSAGQPIVQRVAQVQVPTDHMAALWMVLAKLCEGKVTETGAEGEPVPTCPMGESCQPGNGLCGSNVITSPLPTFTPGQNLDAGISSGLVSGDGGATNMPDAAEDTGAPDDGASFADASDATSPSPPPAYLNNDAVCGFAYGTNPLGSPYDSIRAAPMNTTQLAIAPGFQTAPATGQIVPPQRFQLIANSADLYSALYISPSLSVSSGLSSVNAKTSFAQGTKLDSTDLWVLADFSQAATAQKVVSPALSAQAAAMSADSFYTAYGDRYASQMVTGAEMFCTVRIPTSSQLDKSNLTAMLGFSYGASSVSTSFASSVMTVAAGRNVKVSCGSLGFTPTTPVTTLPSLLSAAQAFQSGTASTLGSVTTSTLYLLYTSYYGIPGYPGVPSGTATRVAAQAPLGPDYLLYDSLVTNDFSAYYADTNAASRPFFADMKAYHDALSTFLSASIANSQSPGVSVPAPAADGVISDWMPTTSLSSTGSAPPQFAVHTMGSGIIPKRISDYAIPLRYAYPDASGNGALKGVTFYPVSPIQPVTSVSFKGPINYQLYLVDKQGPGGGAMLEYQWDTGTYFFPNATNQGVPDATLIGSAITGFTLSGALGTQYVVVNKANGLVMTDNGKSNAMTATHFANGASQLWRFYLDGNGNCTTYVSPTGATPGIGCTASNNTGTPATTPCGSLLYGISSQAVTAMYSGYWEASQAGTAGTPFFANGGGGCDYCCGVGTCLYTSCGGGPVPNDDFFLAPHDNGNTQAIYNFAYTLPGSPVSYAVTDPTQTKPTSSSEPIVVGTTVSGNANELWAFIPSTNVETTP
jgi:hypothetical protein